MPLSRRQFVARSSAALAALPFASPVASALASSMPSAGSAQTFEDLRAGVGMFTQRGGTIGYYAADHALVMVDSQFPDSAQACYDGLDARTPGRASVLDLLVNTHHHGDHTAGNLVVAPLAARHVAHEAVPGIQRVSAVQRGTLDQQAYARETYANYWSASVGDETITLRYYGPAHTAGDSVVHFENANVVHMGDLVFNRLPPYIDLAAGSTTQGWISVMEAAHAQFDDDTLFLFGHGKEGFGVKGTRADLLVQRDLLTALNEHVANGLAAGQSEDEIAVDVLPAFPEHTTARRTIASSIRAVIQEQKRGN
ncbi:MAG: MBL fold metallo-hydrolase [Rubricoccaceae bacterium]